jgi:multidrug efflux system membrane fusion protein
MMQFTTGERAGALTVPRSAVARVGETTTAWVVKDGRVERRTVTTGLASPERVEVLRGLTAGEQVVARGHEGLYAGAKVVDTTSGAATPPGGEQHKGMPGMEEATPPKTSAPPAMPGMGEATPPKEAPHGRH